MIQEYAKRGDARRLRKVIEPIEHASQRLLATTPSQPRRLDRRLSPDTAAQLVAAYEAGATTPGLCQRYQLSKASILKLLNENGVTMRRQPMTEIEIAEAAKLYADGHSLRAISHRLGSAASTIRDALHAHGVTMRPARSTDLSPASRAS